jgi:hypothetical protein
MLNFRIIRLGFYLIAVSLLLASSISANNIATGDQEEWLKSVHESWAKEDSEFKNSPTSPLAGTSRFEISETSTVYFSEKNGQLGWTLEKADQPAFSLINNEGQWQWKGLEKDVSLSRQDKEIPSGSSLAAADKSRTGQFTVEFYPSGDAITALVFDPDTQRLKDFKTLDRFEANPKFALTAKIARFETP